MPPTLGKFTKRSKVVGEEPLEYQKEFDGPQVDLCLIFDLDAVISSAPFPIIRRYTEHIVNAAVDRVCQSHSNMIDGSTGICKISVVQARKALGNLFLDIIRFTKATGATASYHQLKTGVIRRLEYIQKAKVEFTDMLTMICASDKEFETVIARYEEMEGHQRHGAVKRRVNKNELHSLRSKMSIIREHPLLAKEFRNLYDPECFLCVIEKTPLRKNVLNMLNFLRKNSHEDIKIGVFTNSWEREGEYMANQISMEKTGVFAFFTGTCPNEYERQGSSAISTSFDINTLFDIVVQSHMIGEDKPQKSTFLHAIEGLTGSKVVGKEFVLRESTGKGKSADSFSDIDKKKLLEVELSSTMLFTFENRAENAKAALSIGKPYITDSFVIQNGPKDVYRYVAEAVRRAGVIDSRWRRIFNEMEKVIAPLFGVETNRNNHNNVPPEIHVSNGTSGVSWVQMEVSNADGNLLNLPHPQDLLLLPHLVDNENLDLENQEKTNILTYFRSVLPQYFPLSSDPTGISLWDAPSIATSCGPVVFERYTSLKESHANTYRISLRTGSYVLRLSKRDNNNTDILNVPVALEMKSEFDLIRYLDMNSSVPVANPLLYASKNDAPGRELCLVRYTDGRKIRSIRDLIYHSFSRPFSQHRVMSQQTLRPRLFVDAAVDLLVRLHCTAIPDFMKERAKVKMSLLAYSKVADASNDPSQSEFNHPVMNVVNHWSKFLEKINTIVKGFSTDANVNSTKTFQFSTPSTVEAHNLKSISAAITTVKVVELLGNTVRRALIKDNISQTVPSATSLCLIHGNYSLDVLLFSHRSLEGRPKYPPNILQVTDLQGCDIGDPLLDLARLSLVLILPFPYGIVDLDRKKATLWPSVEELVGSYCAKMANMSTSQPIMNITRENILEVFPVYQAAMCLQMATEMLLETVNNRWETNVGGSVSMMNQQQQQTLAQKIAEVGLKLMRIEMPSSKL